MRYFGAAISMFFSLYAFLYIVVTGDFQHLLSGLILFVLSFMLFVSGWNVLREKFSARREYALSDWRNQKFNWLVDAGPSKFEKKKKYYLDLISLYTSLPQKEKEALLDLEQNKRDVQLQEYLDRQLIDNAHILLIGRKEKMILASYGIETAWDIRSLGIVGIPGIDRIHLVKLLEWEHSVAQKFVYNTRQPIDPKVIQQVKNDFERRRRELEMELKNAVTDLRTIYDETMKYRKKIPQKMFETYIRLKQIELDYGAVSP